MKPSRRHLEQTISALRADLREARAEGARAAASALKLGEQLHAMRTDLAEVRARCADHEADAAGWKSETEALRAEVETLRDESHDLTGLIRSLREQLSSARDGRCASGAECNSMRSKAQQLGALLAEGVGL